MLDLKEERKYKRLRRLGQELHLPVPEAFLTLEVFDKDDKLIQRHHQRSHSWTRMAYNVIFSQLACKCGTDDTFEAGKLSAKDTEGNIRDGLGPVQFGWNYSTNLDGVGYGWRAGAGVDDYGILVGSGTNAESFEDFVLQTQIINGVGGGELSHIESEVHSISYAALVLKNELVRYFNNNTVGETSVDVNEVALVAKARPCAYGLDNYYLGSRDHLASTVTVPSTGQLKVTYTIQLTYPS